MHNVLQQLHVQTIADPGLDLARTLMGGAQYLQIIEQ